MIMLLILITLQSSETANLFVGSFNLIFRYKKGFIVSTIVAFPDSALSKL